MLGTKPLKSFYAMQLKIHWLFLMITSMVSCQKNNDQLTIIKHLPKTLEEISGITQLPNHSSLYAINDSGNSPTVFEVTTDGTIAAKHPLPDATNVDWEDLAYDHDGNIYIGDFGNNENNRKDLTIYKVMGLGTAKQQLTKTTFVLEDQKQFPPKKKHRNFDIEAFIYHQESFYLFTKNRSTEFDGITKLYKLPAQTGHHVAQHIDSFRTCKDAKDCFITAAAIHPEGHKIALLTYNKVYLLENFSGDHFFQGTITKHKLGDYSQKEGICFKDEQTLYIVDEKRNHQKGTLYLLKL